MRVPRDLEKQLAGLFLGMLFGYLDNLGLFQGMDALDPLFDVYAPTCSWTGAAGNQKSRRSSRSTRR